MLYLFNNYYHFLKGDLRGIFLIPLPFSLGSRTYCIGSRGERDQYLVKLAFESSFLEILQVSECGLCWLADDNMECGADVLPH